MQRSLTPPTVLCLFVAVWALVGNPMPAAARDGPATPPAVVRGDAPPTGGTMRYEVDPVTRYIHVRYRVPEGAPDEVTVTCHWSPPGAGEWRPAKVMPFVSETALRLLPDGVWDNAVLRGELVERRAGGLERTVIFNPYPEAQTEEGLVDVDFHMQVRDAEDNVLSADSLRVQADNSDVIYIEDWSQVLQQAEVAQNGALGEPRWSWRTDLEEDHPATFGNALYGRHTAELALRPLTYPLDLRGPHAVFICTPPRHGVGLRFTGDERADRISSGGPGEEVLWRWDRLDHQHLVIRQLHAYTGYSTAGLDYVKLVPLSPDDLVRLDGRFAGERDKMLAGYWEPYSWAFYERIRETTQHREPLAAFRQARVDLVDCQIGRFGAKPVFETRVGDQLLYSTIGDPIGTVARPQTDNVGAMQQYTNTLDATVRYAREMGLRMHANFGATNTYTGSPLQSDFARDNPEWVRGHALRYEVPEVREYIFAMIREALEIGAPGISIDFCRYPGGIDEPETCNNFLRELRALADEFSHRRGERVPILIRFPARGVRQWQDFDYPTWIREGLVDYLCPSNIQSRHLHFDVTPYVEAVRGSAVRLLPVVDGLGWGPTVPGPYLWRVQQLYEAGVDGIYMYQADARVLGRVGDRRMVALLGSSEAVARWWEEEAQVRPHRSKGIFITSAHHIAGYGSFERLRVWVDGVELGEMELYLNGELITRTDGPPYLLGSEDTSSDRVIPRGEHELLIRVRDGDGWLEQTFTIKGAG